MLEADRNRNFSVQSYYEALRGIATSDVSWNAILKVKAPMRVTFFMCAQKLWEEDVNNRQSNQARDVYGRLVLYV